MNVNDRATQVLHSLKTILSGSFYLGQNWLKAKYVEAIGHVVQKEHSLQRGWWDPCLSFVLVFSGSDGHQVLYIKSE